jgi:purine-binding chemotaxis protein CheW
MSANLDKKMLDGFSREVKSYLPLILKGIENFQNDPSHHETLDDAIRYVHTIRGASALMGLVALSQIATYVEGLLEEIISGSTDLDTLRNQWIVLTIEQINPYLQCLINGEGENQEIIELIESGYRQIYDQENNLPCTDNPTICLDYSDHDKINLLAYSYFSEDENKPIDIDSDDNSIIEFSENMNADKIDSIDYLDEVVHNTESEKNIEYISESLSDEPGNINLEAKDEKIAFKSEDYSKTFYNQSDTELNSINLNIDQINDIRSEKNGLLEINNESLKALESIISSIDDNIRATYQIKDKSSFVSLGMSNNSLSQRYLLFTVGKSYYAAPVTNILEITRVPSITPMPNVPDWLIGVINLRGEILSVIALSNFLDVDDSLNKNNDDSRLLIVRTEEGTVVTSLMVEQVNGFIQLNSTYDRNASMTLHDKASPYIDGVFELEGVILATLDLEHFLHSPEVCQFY